MERLELKDIAKYCGAETSLKGTVGRISIDSRDVDEDTMFIAIVGERFDGNDFVPDVLAKGVKAVICSRTDIEDERIIVVNDTTQAFLDIAHGYRMTYKIPFVAVTGSVGKTTSKGMVWSVINKQCRAYRTQGNLNNNIGVSKTLLALERDYEAAVIEMGMDHAGEITALSLAAEPDIAVITNVGTAHIENLGSREGILKAKCEITAGLKKGAPLVINADNDMLATLKEGDFKLVKFGIDAKNCYMTAENIVSDAAGSKFTAVCESGERAEVFVPAVGIHQVYNAICALTVGKLLGYTLASSAQGIADYVPEGMRQNVKSVNGMTFIEDCYNANPDSMDAALRTLKAIKKTRAVAVLSDMLALGEMSESAHRKVGKTAAKLGCDAVFSFGEYGRFIAAEAEKNGCKAFWYESKEQLTADLGKYLKKDDTVLFKGSRGMKTEEVFLSLYKEWEV